MFLLDTNIVSYFLRGSAPALIERIHNSIADELAISTISAGELYFGLRRLQPSQRAKKLTAQLQALTDAVAVRELPVEAAWHYGAIKATLQAAGTPIGESDLWIAAHALSANMTLVTNNMSEFQRVPGLKLDNWIAA
jgi:tRNA(fMet)-specific endonuclease VapC